MHIFLKTLNSVFSLSTLEPLISPCKSFPFEIKTNIAYLQVLYGEFNLFNLAQIKTKHQNWK